MFLRIGSLTHIYFTVFHDAKSTWLSSL